MTGHADSCPCSGAISDDSLTITALRTEREVLMQFLDTERELYAEVACKLEKVKRDKVENMALRQICTDLHWMARRYADGRSSYATSLFNERTRSLLAMKVQLNDCDGTIWARDAMGRNYDGLTEEEAREGE